MDKEYQSKYYFCEHCQKNLEFKLDPKQLENLKNSQLFNFVLMHASDHALVLSIDGNGNIRRTRIAALNSVEGENEDIGDYRKIQAITESKSLNDAFNIWIKK